MNPLLRLLAQQSGASVPVPTEDIVVKANQGPDNVGAPVDGMSAPNMRAIEAVQDDIKTGQEASDRRGMFGVKGTLRDVLGLLGDAFLVQGGRNAIYAPHREKEKIADAWAGATENPMAAAERVGYYDADKGQELLEAAKNAELRQDQLNSLTASREALASERQFRKYKQAKEMLGGLLNTPGAVVNGVISPDALRIAEKIASKAGMTLEEFMIKEGMSEADVRNYAKSVLDTYKQERLEDYDIGLEQGERNANSRAESARASMIRAQRPPAGRAPPQPTEAAEIARIRGKVNRQETLSPGDRETWNNYLRKNAPKRGGSTSRSFPTAPRFGAPRSN